LIRIYLTNLARRSFTAATGIAPRSMQSNLKHGEEVIFNLLTTTVTASWLEVEQTSYAIRHLRKLQRHIVAPPRIEAGCVFILFIILSIWQLLRTLGEPESAPLHWFLLVLCVAVVFASSYVVFVMPSVYRLDVTIANETKPLPILCPTRADLDNLNDALLQAMDYYRGDPEYGPDLESPNLLNTES